MRVPAAGCRLPRGSVASPLVAADSTVTQRHLFAFVLDYHSALQVRGMVSATDPAYNKGPGAPSSAAATSAAEEVPVEETRVGIIADPALSSISSYGVRRTALQASTDRPAFRLSCQDAIYIKAVYYTLLKLASLASSSLQYVCVWVGMQVSQACAEEPSPSLRSCSSTVALAAHIATPFCHARR